MLGTVVAAASVAAIVIDAVVPALAAIVVNAVVPCILAHLMLALLMVRRIVTAAACLRDGRHAIAPATAGAVKAFV